MDATQIRVIENCKIAVWFSNGAASAVAAKLTIEKYGANNEVIIINNPIREEHKDNRRFLKEVEKWLGQPIQTAVNKKYSHGSAELVWRTKRYMSGIKGAPCTYELKKQAREQWEMINKPDFHVLGFTVEEKSRHKHFTLTERNNVLPILIDAALTKQDCFDILIKAGIKPPVIYELGLPNANCIGCVKATSATYWNLIRKLFPIVFKRRSQLSRLLGVRLVRHKGKRIFLDELPMDAKGRSLKTMKMPECGIFCGINRTWEDVTKEKQH